MSVMYKGWWVGGGGEGGGWLGSETRTLLVQELTKIATMGPDHSMGRTVVALLTAFVTDHLYVDVWQDRFVLGEVFLQYENF